MIPANCIRDMSSFFRTISLSLLCGLPVALAGYPPFITLQGLVRDFRCTFKHTLVLELPTSTDSYVLGSPLDSCLHVDFESPVNWYSEQKGLFLPGLTKAPDSRPITTPPQLRTSNSLQMIRSRQSDTPWVGTEYAISNFGQYFLEEYYLDVPGVNIAIPVDITLELIDEVNGIYRYKAQEFFPINDRGYVRELLDSSSLSAQRNRVKNYWFTTEFRLRFFYRGGEVFNFLGDDDLWVFINGNLTSCDLGSIHVARPCSIQLDSIGLLPNSTNEMLILHAERHYFGSTFELTTSIVPINQPPIATGVSVILKEGTKISFQLQGFDPDYNPNLMFAVLTEPSFGTLSVPVQTWLPFNSRILYQPRQYFTGNDSFTYLMTDGMLNSTAATVTITVSAVDNPPVAIDSTEEVMVGDKITFQLKANDVDTAQQDLKFYLVNTPEHGYVQIDGRRQGIVSYEGVTAGNDVIQWQVSDGMTFVPGTTTIQVKVNPDLPFGTGGIRASQLAGIVIGGIVACTLLAIGLAYVLYYQIAAKRFQKQWEEEFRNAQMMQNPLYKAGRKEHFNPLYEAAANSSTRL